MDARGDGIDEGELPPRRPEADHLVLTSSAWSRMSGQDLRMHAHDEDLVGADWAPHRERPRDRVE